MTVSQGYSSNIFATRNDMKDDFITLLQPEVDLNASGAGYRGELSAGAEIGRYWEYTSEDYEDYYVTGDGTVRIAPGWGLFGGLGYYWEHEERESPDDVAGAEPTEYENLQGYAGVYGRTGKVTTRLGATYEGFDFHDVPASGGSINNDDRDRHEGSLGLRLGYEVAPAWTALFQGAVEKRSYEQETDDAGFDRDSDAWRAAVGVLYRPGRELSVELLGGVMNQDFDDPSFETVETFDLAADVSWQPSQATLVRGYLDRSIEETTLAGASSYVSTGGGISLRQALRPDLSLGAGVSFYEDDYQGVSRLDRIFGASANLKYFFLPNFFVGTDYSFQQRDSSASGADYDEHRLFFSIGAELQPGYDEEQLAAAGIEAEPQGLYGGLQATVSNVGTELAGTRAGGGGTLTADFADHGFGGGAFAGYGLFLGDWYLGLELDAELSEAEWTHVRAPDGRDFSVEKEAGYGASALFGYRLMGGELVYGRFGVVGADMETRYSDLGSGESRKKDELLGGLRFGVGAEAPVSNGLFLRLDYSYTDYESYEIGVGQFGDDDFANSESAFRLGIGYRFGAEDDGEEEAFVADFSGPYVGVQAGLGALNTDVEGPRSGGSTLDAQFGDEGFSGGLFAGYGHTFGDFYLGVEGELDANHVRPDHERSPTGRVYSVDKELSAGASLRGGVLLGGSTLVYGRVGPVWTRFDTKYQEGGESFDEESVEMGLRFGGGLEIAASESVFVRMDYTYTDYGSSDIDYSMDRKDSFENSESLFRVGVGYRF